MTLGLAIILIIVAAIGGYIFGIIDSRVTASLRKKTEVIAPTAQPAADQPNRLGEHTVLKVTIDKTLKWHLELDGVWLEDPGALNPEQRRRAINVVVQMRPWLDGKPATVAPAITAPPPAPELPTLKPLNTSTAAQPPAVNAPLKIDALRGFHSLLKNDVKAPGAHKSLSIVAMIDEVLQAKLLGTPFSDKAIRLEDGDLGEVIVWVGSQRYAGVDAVPDPEIRALIKAASADWEKK